MSGWNTSDVTRLHVILAIGTALDATNSRVKAAAMNAGIKALSLPQYRTFAGVPLGELRRIADKLNNETRVSDVR